MDLERVIQDRSLPLPLADIKSYLRMLLEGLNHCHKFGIIHRVRSRFLSLSLSLCAPRYPHTLHAGTARSLTAHSRSRFNYTHPRRT